MEYWNGLSCHELPCSEARMYLFTTYFRVATQLVEVSFLEFYEVKGHMHI